MSMAMTTVARGSHSQMQAEALRMLRRSCTPSNDADRDCPERIVFHNLVRIDLDLEAEETE
jgi:hypothetical protein